jgi:DNA-directed RNA polymerase specialized sigma24 family protein
MAENYGELQKAAKKITSNNQLWEELLQYTLDEFLRKPNLQDILNSGASRFYCVRIMLNSYHSATSPFYYTYRKPSVSLYDCKDVEAIKEEDQTPIIEMAERAKEILNRLPWYDRMLFETFVEESHTVSSLARATGIPRTSVSLTINRVRRHLKNNL